MRNFFLLCVLFYCFSLYADSVEIDGIYYNLIEKAKSAHVTKNPNVYKGEIVIPEKVTYESIEYTVKSIEESAFNSCGELTKVEIPNSVNSIGDYAFSSCYSLNKITIPTSVESIGNGAFASCRGIESVVIPDGTKTIGWDAFRECKKLKEVHISKSVETIGSASFYLCEGLLAVYIDDLEAWCKIQSQGTSWNPLFYAHHLFLNNVEVNDLVIPNTVNRIEEGTFVGGNFSSITIPENVTEISNFAFSDCMLINNIELPKNITSLGVGIFANCKSLEHIVLPKGIKEIYGSSLWGQGTFSYIIGLKDFSIPDGVNKIGWGAFIGCENLRTIVIPESVDLVENSAFANCTNIEDVYCYAKNIPTSSSNIFEDSMIEYATLHVPSSSVDVYKSNPVWGKFKSVVSINEGDPNITRIENVLIDNDTNNVIYDLNGRRVSQPSKGIHIINGKKVLLK